MSERSWKWLSALVSLALIGVLLLIWQMMNHYEPVGGQLVSDEVVDQYLKKNWEPQVTASMEPTVRIKTGIFIQSLSFVDAAEVNLTGFIWQHYQDGVNSDEKPKEGEVGFVLPEQVNTGSDIDPREVYRIRNGDDEVIGWYFEATLRQTFEYSTYPFDNKTVWVRIWPKDFSRNIVLVPDLAAYRGTTLKDIFGIDESIVLGTWMRTDTYFDYHPASYDTNFGIANYIGMADFPELRYNFVLRRQFGDAFIVHLLPLLMVLALLYGALLTVTDNSEMAERLGFSATGVIGSCSALFFVVLLAHMQLREQFAGSEIVYIEYFYFLMYVLLVGGAAYSYVFVANPSGKLSFLYSRNNLGLKVGFWPFVLACLAVISLVVMLLHPAS